MDISFKQNRKGDKKNSPYFEEYIEKIYDRREKSGLDSLLGNMRAVVVHITHGEAVKYMSELYLMTPYRFKAGIQTATHKLYILSIKPEYPSFIILEPIDPNYEDTLSAVNRLSPRGIEKVQARYIGEIYKTQNLADTRRILEEQEIRFMDEPKNALLSNKNFEFTQLSSFTNNSVGYTTSDLLDFESLELGTPFELTTEELDLLARTDTLQRHFGMFDLIYGIDHLATRVLSGQREDAILEFLTMSNHYFWGAYNIEEQNSSTNICRNPLIQNELHSPAKVFTANNTPFYVKSINNLPSPTEDFVRNFGQRLHHMAYEVEDGETESLKNIDYVVKKLSESDIPFLAQIIGECRDIPDLKQIFSKTSKYSIMITEYVQRCKGFDGFFTKTNVGYLTQAAGEEEALRKKYTGQ